MANPRLILFAEKLSECQCYARVFGREFDVEVTETIDAFLKATHQSQADAAVLCYCCAEEHDVPSLVRLTSVVGPMPVLACSKTYNPNFVAMAAKQGVNHFLLCDMSIEQIQLIVMTAIRGHTLKSLFEYCWPGCLESTPFAGKLLAEISNEFPQRLSTSTIAERFGLSTRSLQSVCKRTFGSTFTQIIRRIWVFHALEMMKNTDLDNTAIAVHLNYSDQSSLARIFQRELGLNLGESRKRLAVVTPLELLFQID